MGSAFDALAHHVANLGEFAHEMILRVQTTGGVDDQHVDVAGLGGFAGVVSDRRRVGPHLLLHDLHADPIGPDRELIDGGGAEGVAGAHHHLLVHLILQQPGELGDAGGFAGAIDAGDEDDGRTARGETKLTFFRRPPSCVHLLLDDGLSIGRVFDFAEAPAVANLADHVRDVLHAHVGADEFLLHLGEERVVDLPAGNEQRPNVGVKHLGGFLECAFEFVDCLGEKTHGDCGMTKFQ